MDSDDESAPGDGVASLIAKANELKALGNEHFTAGDLVAATAAYEQAVAKLTSDAAKTALRVWWKSNPGETDTASPLLAACHNNLAACHVKAQQWESALRAASAAVDLDPSLVKARLRRGVACSHVGRLAEAKADLTAVIKADPKNREARAALELVLAKLKEQASSERAMMGKAFEGLAKEEAAIEAREKAAKAQALAKQEAALLHEWRQECDALRQRGPPNPAIDLLASAAATGDAEARAALDKLAPLTLEEFGQVSGAECATECATHASDGLGWPLMASDGLPHQAKLKAATKERARQEEREAKRKADEDLRKAEEVRDSERSFG